MTFDAPIAVTFVPIFKPKVWGGRALADHLGKRLPALAAIGESWELVSLPGAESRVLRGPLAGTTLAELAQRWGPRLLGDAPLVDGRFPLLIKFLDAREPLSVQVHPKPQADGAWLPGVKHEAWYVVHAEPDTELFIGLREGVGGNDVAAAVRDGRIRELLRRWPVVPGQCYYLPSGVVHALGGGILVAEIQTPSDVTYRLYDWDRFENGAPRTLHVDAALANLRTDVTADQILACAGDDAMKGANHETVESASVASRPLLSCERFAIARRTLAPGAVAPISGDAMEIWIILDGACAAQFESATETAAKGETLLVPARRDRAVVRSDAGCQFLAVAAAQRFS